MELLQNLQFEFDRLKKLADKGLAQVSVQNFFTGGSAEANSIAVIVKHVGGNLKSRWTDFLTTDGEKPDRNRNTEFEISPDDTRSSLMALWDVGWQTLQESIARLSVDDLSKIVTIRSESHTVLQAINRSLSHTAYHVGQITLLAKHFAGAGWKSLSVPKGKSAEAAAKKGNYFDH